MAISGCQKGWSETRCNIIKHNTEIPCLKLGTTKQWFHVRLHIRLLMLQIQRFYYCAHYKSWRATTYCYRVLPMVLTWDRKVLWNTVESHVAEKLTHLHFSKQQTSGAFSSQVLAVHILDMWREILFLTFVLRLFSCFRQIPWKKHLQNQVLYNYIDLKGDICKTGFKQITTVCGCTLKCQETLRQSREIVSCCM